MPLILIAKFINMKKLFQTLKIVVLALVLTAGINWASATYISRPGVAPTGGNTPAPLNIGSAPQSRIGNLALGTANAPAANLDVYGSIIANSIASFANTTVTGNVTASSLTLSGMTGTGNQSLCVNSSGSLVACGASTQTTNSGQWFSTVPGASSMKISSLNLPAGVTSITVHIWGGGGAGSPYDYSSVIYGTGSGPVGCGSVNYGSANPRNCAGNTTFSTTGIFMTANGGGSSWGTAGGAGGTASGGSGGTVSNVAANVSGGSGGNAMVTSSNSACYGGNGGSAPGAVFGGGAGGTGGAGWQQVFTPGGGGLNLNSPNVFDKILTLLSPAKAYATIGGGGGTSTTPVYGTSGNMYGGGGGGAGITDDSFCTSSNRNGGGGGAGGYARTTVSFTSRTQIISWNIGAGANTTTVGNGASGADGGILITWTY